MDEVPWDLQNSANTKICYLSLKPQMFSECNVSPVKSPPPSQPHSPSWYQDRTLRSGDKGHQPYLRCVGLPSARLLWWRADFPANESSLWLCLSTLPFLPLNLSHFLFWPWCSVFQDSFLASDHFPWPLLSFSFPATYPLTKLPVLVFWPLTILT